MSLATSWSGAVAKRPTSTGAVQRSAVPQQWTAPSREAAQLTPGATASRAAPASVVVAGRCVGASVPDLAGPVVAPADGGGILASRTELRGSGEQLGGVGQPLDDARRRLLLAPPGRPPARHGPVDPERADECVAGDDAGDLRESWHRLGPVGPRDVGPAADPASARQAAHLEGADRQLHEVPRARQRREPGLEAGLAGDAALAVEDAHSRAGGRDCDGGRVRVRVNFGDDRLAGGHGIRQLRHRAVASQDIRVRVVARQRHGVAAAARAGRGRDEPVEPAPHLTAGCASARHLVVDRHLDRVTRTVERDRWRTTAPAGHGAVLVRRAAHGFAETEVNNRAVIDERLGRWRRCSCMRFGCRRRWRADGLRGLARRRGAATLHGQQHREGSPRGSRRTHTRRR